MWDRIDQALTKRSSKRMADTVLRALRDRGGPAIFFSGHLANWEIGFAVAASLGLTVSWFYRAASNKLADAAI